MTQGSGPQNTKEIKSLRTAFDIIEIVSENDGVRASQITAQLDYAPSTIHYYLTTLVNHRFLTKKDHVYRIGLRFLTTGGIALTASPLYPVMDGPLRELSNRTGESVQVAVEEGGRCIYLYHVPGAKPIGSTRHIGTETPLHATAAGKAMLAHAPLARVNEILDAEGLGPVARNTITSRRELVQELEAVTERGVAFEHQEFDDEVNALSAPIESDGEMLGAVELSLPTTRIHDPRERTKEKRFSNELVELVTETARTIESRV